MNTSFNGKIVFMDRDGVINEKAPEGDYIKSWQEFRLLPDVDSAIRLLNEHGYKILIITNQRGIARGLMAMETVQGIHKKLNQLLEKSGAHIDGFYVCPHEKGTCHCRKPDIGLFLQAEKDFFVNKGKSWMIGDSQTDIQAGQNYGVKTIAIGKNLPGSNYWFENLYQAVQFIVK